MENLNKEKYSPQKKGDVPFNPYQRPPIPGDVPFNPYQPPPIPGDVPFNPYQPPPIPGSHKVKTDEKTK